jgi:hypothetical protein
MFIPHFAHPGKKAVASVQGSVWKFVSCERCPQRYAYLLELEATGEDLALLSADGSPERALAKAQENLSQKKQRCILPVPCPCCGHYQAEMSRLLKEEASLNLFQIGGGLMTVLGFIPLAFDIASNWVITLVFGAAGVCLMAYGYYLSFRFDPNAGDPEPRKVLGQRHTVWGDQLAKLLAASPDVTPDLPGRSPADY